MPDQEAGLHRSITAQAAVLYDLVVEYLQTPLSASGINLGTFELLSAVRSVSGRATQAELAERLGITAPSLSEAVKSAIRKGLLQQVVVEGDRRARRIELTPQGEGVLKSVLEALNEAEGYATEGMTEREISQTVHALRQASANLARHLESR